MTDKEQLEIWIQGFDSVPEEAKQYRWDEIFSLHSKARERGSITPEFFEEVDEWLFSWDDPVSEDDEYYDH